MKLIKIRKDKARKLFAENKRLIIVGDNVNEFNILGGWHCGCEIDPQGYASPEWTFDNMVANFEFYLERELGRRAAYYVEAK